MGIGKGEKFEKCPRCEKRGVYHNHGYPPQAEKACRYCGWLLIKKSAKKKEG